MRLRPHWVPLPIAGLAALAKNRTRARVQARSLATPQAGPLLFLLEVSLGASEESKFVVTLSEAPPQGALSGPLPARTGSGCLASVGSAGSPGSVGPTRGASKVLPDLERVKGERSSSGPRSHVERQGSGGSSGGRDAAAAADGSDWGSPGPPPASGSPVSPLDDAAARKQARKVVGAVMRVYEMYEADEVSRCVSPLHEEAALRSAASLLSSTTADTP